MYVVFGLTEWTTECVGGACPSHCLPFRVWLFVLGAKWGKSTGVSSFSMHFFSQSHFGGVPPLRAVPVSSSPQVSLCFVHSRE